MATEIYKTYFVYTLNGEEIEISPLKIKYMRMLMKSFEMLPHTSNDDEAISVLVDCVRVAMKQFFPSIKTSEDVEDFFDLPTIYKILEYSAGIKINKDSNNTEQPMDSEKTSGWDDLDLVKLESEAFLLGIWKNFDELESSVSLNELITIISTNRELDFEEKKFLAAIQGVDLGGEIDSSGKERGQKEWEDLKARVFSKGKATDSNDILALQGVNAQKVGFGIGMGLDYEDLR